MKEKPSPNKLEYERCAAPSDYSVLNYIGKAPVVAMRLSNNLVGFAITEQRFGLGVNGGF